MNDAVFDNALVEMAAALPVYFRRRVSDWGTVEDLTQETLLRAYRARCALREHTRFEAWMYGIAHHTLADHYRRVARISEARHELPHVHATERNDVRAVLISSARCYLDTLPREYHDPVYLAEYEGVAHNDIAERLGLTLSATKSRVRRGKMMVRDLMEARCKFEYDCRGNIIGYEVRPCSPRPPGR